MIAAASTIVAITIFAAHLGEPHGYETRDCLDDRASEERDQNENSLSTKLHAE